MIRLMSSMAVVKILLGHLVCENPQSELYMICACSFATCIMSLLVLITHSGFFLLFIGTPLVFLSIFGMLGLVVLTIAMSMVLIFAPTPGSRMLRATAVCYYFLAIVIGIGLVLTITNRHLPNIESAKKIWLSNWYFLFPTLFLLLGIYFWWKATLRLPRKLNV